MLNVFSILFHPLGMGWDVVTRDTFSWSQTVFPPLDTMFTCPQVLPSRFPLSHSLRLLHSLG